MGAEEVVKSNQSSTTQTVRLLTERAFVTDTLDHQPPMFLLGVPCTMMLRTIVRTDAQRN